jgi:hypothetical protein
VIKIVKALSIALGVLIVGALGVLAYGLFYRTTPEKPQQENAASPMAVAPMVAIESFEAVGLGQPVGSTVAGVTAQGTLVYLTVQGGGLPDRVLAVDIAKRRVLGRIEMGDADSRPPRPAR